MISAEVLFYIGPVRGFYLNGRVTDRKAGKTFSVPNNFIKLQTKLYNRWSLNPGLKKKSLHLIRNGPESKAGKYDFSGKVLETTDCSALGT